MRDRYWPIADYGVIGDLRTAALVSRDGGVDWWCLPRFNDPSVFAALLDAERGGRWRIGPAAPATSEQRYLPGTNVLVTTFHFEAGGAAAVTDFLPMGAARIAEPVLFRRVVGHRGRVPMATVFHPRFAYGRDEARLTARRAGLTATDSTHALALSAWPELEWAMEGGAATARFDLEAGEERWFVLRWDHDETPAAVTLGPQAALDATIDYWDTWVAPLDYHGPYRAEVQRSALALKLLQYEPSGAIVAAPTTSLPEWLGAGRNWDYRYTWLRDSAYVLYALDSLGILSEAEAFIRFLVRACRRDDASHLQVLYSPHGDREADERVLDHLEGYAGSGPVRIGNGAANQFQLDVYGELLDTIAIAHRTQAPGEAAWASMNRLVDWVADNWRRPDWGIWEERLAPRHHVSSKVMAWTALDRGAALAEQHQLRGDVARWRAEAEAVKAEVLDRGWDPGRGTFVQGYGEPALDASVLLIPKVHFIHRTDPRVRSTLDAVRRELGAGPEELIYRYRTADGLNGDEGAFVACSFWMVQNVALTGDFDEAERLFRLLLRRASPLGLFAEEIDPRTGDHLGNYPLGLSHAALINTAVMLERLRAVGQSDSRTVG